MYSTLSTVERRLKLWCRWFGVRDALGTTRKRRRKTRSAYRSSTAARCTSVKSTPAATAAKWATDRTCTPLLQSRYATKADTYQQTTFTCATNQCVPYAAKHTTRATANADIATSCLTWFTAVVSAVADERKTSSKHPPEDPARFLPRLPNPKDLSQTHELQPPLTRLPGPTSWSGTLATAT